MRFVEHLDFDTAGVVSHRRSSHVFDVTSCVPSSFCHTFAAHTVVSEPLTAWYFTCTISPASTREGKDFQSRHPGRTSGVDRGWGDD